MATGWLGWTPDVAWRTPIPELLVAMDARVEWANMTNPFGGKPKKKPESPEEKRVRIKAALRGRSGQSHEVLA
ncbi:hypothetical protein [Azorhizophilus paspali]|uniref:Uncharacterized protein n=1 Tax=Azorhizophilus paspali TaxID=69963 RepID=A0ABV6SI68_AZOPA